MCRTKMINQYIEFFCILLFELQQSLEMFWRWCRNTFSNVAKQGIILLFEPSFVFNPICQAVERESTSSRRNRSELHKFCSNCRGPPKCTGSGNSFALCSIKPSCKKHWTSLLKICFC